MPRKPTLADHMTALTQTVELLGSMQQTTEKHLQQLADESKLIQKDIRSLTREMRLFRHFVLSLGAPKGADEK